MTENERDPKVSQRYRELGAQEPPRALDEAILAASRRAAKVHPAPLVAPTGRRRWYFPLAAAAVIVLSVVVTWHMQTQERPDPDGVALYERKPAQADAARDKPRQETAEVARRVEPQAAPAAPAADDVRGVRREAQAESRLRAAPAAAAPAAKPAPEMRAMGKIMAMDALPPEKQLERIAELRQAAKHDEADRLLAEFRRRHPDYRIPPEVLEKVERK